MSKGDQTRHVPLEGKLARTASGRELLHFFRQVCCDERTLPSGARRAVGRNGALATFSRTGFDFAERSLALEGFEPVPLHDVGLAQGHAVVALVVRLLVDQLTVALVTSSESTVPQTKAGKGKARPREVSGNKKYNGRTSLLPGAGLFVTRLSEAEKCAVVFLRLGSADRIGRAKPIPSLFAKNPFEVNATATRAGGANW